MAKAAFRETGKPAPGKFVTKSESGVILVAPGAGKAYIMYDFIYDSNHEGELQLESGGSTVFILHPNQSCNLNSPIQWPENTQVFFEGGVTPRLTITYDIIEV